ncbi:MAG: MarR family transcriptional regulator [Methylobacterium sp.]|jgi:DNA-binding MarR family transcriptional regulator|nr:MarR family transcriptional regulator [Methylobacterium sp.]MCA3603726.1 MarR family transcriptional regulator [Methylobacterium sp.]MCA3615398.1 MarR family transcriptional regulator [Methylobacterium sp.]MCA3627532.1 MarR family transcriptional regulator [Methylobacterium sp.]
MQTRLPVVRPGLQGGASLNERPWDHPRFRNWIWVGRLHAIWDARLSAAIAPHGIRLAQFDILANLVHEPGITQQHLAKRLFIGRSSLSMALPELERMGWLRREGDPEDKRIRRLFLTPEGVAKAELGLAEQLRLLKEMMTVLTAEECDQLGEKARRMADHLKKMPETR